MHAPVQITCNTPLSLLNISAFAHHFLDFNKVHLTLETNKQINVAQICLSSTTSKKKRLVRFRKQIYLPLDEIGESQCRNIDSVLLNMWFKKIEESNRTSRLSLNVTHTRNFHFQ